MSLIARGLRDRLVRTKHLAINDTVRIAAAFVVGSTTPTTMDVINRDATPKTFSGATARRQRFAALELDMNTNNRMIGV